MELVASILEHEQLKHEAMQQGHKTTKTSWYIHHCITTPSYIQRSVQGQSLHQLIARWLRSRRAITIGKVGLRYAFYLPKSQSLLTSSIECLSAPASHPGSTALQMDSPCWTNSTTITAIIHIPISYSPHDNYLSSPECHAIRVCWGVLHVDHQTSQQSLHRDELAQYPWHSMSTSTWLEQDARNTWPIVRGFTIAGYPM